MRRCRKKVSAAGFRLAGSGWYETDFKSSGKRNLVDKGGGAESSGKSESKPAKSEASKASTGSSGNSSAA